MYRRTLVALALIAAPACSNDSPLPLSKQIEADFGDGIQRYGIRSCRFRGKIAEAEGHFRGTFFPSEGHALDFFNLEDGLNYAIIPSNDLMNESDNSSDGTGGPTYSDTFDHPERESIIGTVIKADLRCSGKSLKDDGNSGIVLIQSYGIRR